MKISSLPVDHFDGTKNMGRGTDGHDGMILRDLLDLMLVHRAPSNLKTAVFTATADATWEDVDLVALLNDVLTTLIREGEAVELRGMFEVVNTEAFVNNVKWADGGTPDNDPSVKTFATAAASASEYVPARADVGADLILVTDDEGQIKIEVDDLAHVGFRFHLFSWRYARNTLTT